MPALENTSFRKAGCVSACDDSNRHVTLSEHFTKNNSFTCCSIDVFVFKSNKIMIQGF